MYTYENKQTNTTTVAKHAKHFMIADKVDDNVNAIIETTSTGTVR